MSNKTEIDNLLLKIAQLEDDIACAEHDEEMTGESGMNLDDARCRLADLQDELKTLEAGQ